MQYIAIVTKEGIATLAEFPDCPGCQTFVRDDEGESIEHAAAEALSSWLKSMMAHNYEIKAPSRRVRLPKGARAMNVQVPLRLAAKLQVREARRRAKLTQADLAQRAGVSQQQIAKLEHPDAGITLESLEKVARALGTTVELNLAAEATRQRRAWAQ